MKNDRGLEELKESTSLWGSQARRANSQRHPRRVKCTCIILFTPNANMAGVIS
jgi:hypothetical protein